jgi:peptide/nickel transport system ATP-binding protein
VPILEVRNVNVTFSSAGANPKRVAAVRGVSLVVDEQDSVGIVGESGSGKSTLALAILRMLPNRTAQVEGEIRFDGLDLLALPEARMAEIRWKRLSVVFQKSMNSLSPVHKIGAQMADIYRIHEPAAPRAEVKRRMIELLEMVNLPARVYDQYPHELSGGMMQRVSIALSLMHHPRLLILDEATTALDVITQGQILDEIMALERRLNTTRIMITHDMSVVAYACKKVAVMYAGRLMEFGDVRTVLADPQHPYTQGLLATIPPLTGEKRYVRGIPGSIPDLSEPIRGCVFAPRCAYARDICREQEPPAVDPAGGRTAACHFAGTGGDGHDR